MINETRTGKWCNYCQKNTHDDSECWSTRPKITQIPTLTGWRCPGCGACYAPSVQMCALCSPPNKVTCGGTT